MKTFVWSVWILFLTAFLLKAEDPRFSDMAVFFSKTYFRQYVKPVVSIEEYVLFLDQHGVCFSLFDLLDPAVVVEKEDFEKIPGQLVLLFRGEAEVKNGCIILPNEMSSWVDYCVLNDVPLADIWSRFR